MGGRRSATTSTLLACHVLVALAWCCGDRSGSSRSIAGDPFLRRTVDMDDVHTVTSIDGSEDTARALLDDSLALLSFNNLRALRRKRCRHFTQCTALTTSALCEVAATLRGTNETMCRQEVLHVRLPHERCMTLHNYLHSVYYHSRALHRPTALCRSPRTCPTATQRPP